MFHGNYRNGLTTSRHSRSRKSPLGERVAVIDPLVGERGFFMQVVSSMEMRMQELDGDP